MNNELSQLGNQRLDRSSMVIMHLRQATRLELVWQFIVALIESSLLVIVSAAVPHVLLSLGLSLVFVEIVIH